VTDHWPCSSLNLLRANNWSAVNCDRELGRLRSIGRTTRRRAIMCVTSAEPGVVPALRSSRSARRRVSIRGGREFSMKAISTESNALIFCAMTQWASTPTLRVLPRHSSSASWWTSNGGPKSRPSGVWRSMIPGISRISLSQAISRPIHIPKTRGNDLRRDLSFDDVVTIRGLAEPGSAAGLLALLRDFTTVSAVELSRSKLPSGCRAATTRAFHRHRASSGATTLYPTVRAQHRRRLRTRKP